MLSDVPSLSFLYISPNRNEFTYNMFAFNFMTVFTIVRLVSVALLRESENAKKHERLQVAIDQTEIGKFPAPVSSWTTCR